MVKKAKIVERFEYKKLSKEEMEARGILGRLYGVIADFKNPTRNGRFYSKELWIKTLNSETFKEKIENKLIVGEIEHPEDRAAIDPREGAICLAEMPTFGDDGNLYGVFDILDTPNGRILNTYCKYGTKIGISSRAQGDLIQGANGEEVDPDTYDFETWDAVFMPAVKHARQTYVTESVSKLNQALNESIEKATEEDREVMKKTIEKINKKLNASEIDSSEDDLELNKEVEDPQTENDIELAVTDTEPENPTAKLDCEDEDNIATDSDTVEEECDEEECELSEDDKEKIFLEYLASHFDEKAIKKACKALDIDVEDVENDETSTEDIPSDDIDDETKEDDEENSEVVDNESDELLKNLQEALQTQADLEVKVKTLNEELAARDSRVNSLTEENSNYKSAIVRLSKLAKSSKSSEQKVLQLEESIKEKDSKIAEHEKTISDQQGRITRLVNESKARVRNANSLNENLVSKDAEVKKLNESIEALTEKLSKQESESTIKVNQLTENLNKSKELIEKHKRLEQKLINKYIENKATTLGLTSIDVKRKLGESYTIEDVDKVCEDLKDYQLNVSRLPFNVDTKASVRFTESVQSRKAVAKKGETPDDDSTLENIARMFM